MITKQTAFQSGDQLFPTIEAAQAHELEAFIIDKQLLCQDHTELAKRLIQHKEHIVDLLTMKASSKARARKANGATRKPRTPKNTDKPAEAKLI
jgi:hypothetical protein